MEQEQKNYRQPWFKFYAQDWMTDVKIMRLKIEDRICYITLLCLAATSSDRGMVKGIDEHTLISLSHLYQDPYETNNEYTRAKGCIERFESNGSVTVLRYGDELMDVTIKSFAKRQASSLTNSERQAKFRERNNPENKPKNKGKKKEINSNEIVTGSNAKVTYREEKRREDINTAETSSALIPDLIKLFEEVNPACKKMYGNKTQRAACQNLIDEYGFDEVSKVIAILPKSNLVAYLPTITTPAQLWDKYQSLKAGLGKKKNELVAKGRGIA